jgi:hypothetical protein
MGTDGIREHRLMATFVHLLDDHKQAFEGFFADISAVRFCQTPIDGQQLGRIEYALRNMDILLLTIQNCIQDGSFEGETKDVLVQTKNAWIAKKSRVDNYLGAIHQIIESTSQALRPLRTSAGA